MEFFSLKGNFFSGFVENLIWLSKIYIEDQNTLLVIFLEISICTQLKMILFLIFSKTLEFSQKSLNFNFCIFLFNKFFIKNFHSAPINFMNMKKSFFFFLNYKFFTFNLFK